MTTQGLGELSNAPDQALIGEILGRAAAQGERQRDAFVGLQTSARLMVRNCVAYLLENGCPPDGVADAYEGEDGRYWELRAYNGNGRNSRYGGGELTSEADFSLGASRSYIGIVADGKGNLTTIERHGSMMAYPSLQDPTYVIDDVFNVQALRSSTGLCNTVLQEIITDIASVTTRSFSRK